jgi:uncharacterized membrane protein SirB2
MPLDYVVLKATHVTCVALSYLGFFARGIWMIRGSALLEQRWVRIAPHVVDTILLASAVGLAFMLRLSPLVQPWLAAKIAGLVLYVILGTIALRRGRPRALRIGAWIAAQATFLYIVAVALTRSPAPWN